MKKLNPVWCFFYTCLAVFFLGNPIGAVCEEFLYKHQAGDKYRIISTVQEDVYVNGKLNHRAEILNRIAVDVIDTAGDSGHHKAVFQTSERASGWGSQQRSFQWSREYDSEFERDSLGRLTIDPQYFMPVVRDVPVLPGKDLKVGERWTADGHEMHDFRDSFGIPDPYRIPFTANYVFLGDRKWKGKTYPAFSVSYRVTTSPPAVPGYLWPKRIIGISDQTVYWDRELGQPSAYEEKFRIEFELSDGTKVVYQGKADAEIIESKVMDKEKIIEEINEEIQRLNIPDAEVRVVDEGITISLENIQFEANTAKMLPGEREKLDKIADILKRYAERDILVGGHTANDGIPTGHMELSTERAAVVADYLVRQKVRSSDRIVVRGYGAEKPIADNRTEEGMRKNRRVEITILEN